MVSLVTIQEKLQLAQAYFIELLDEHITSLKNGSCSTNNSKLKCLNRLIRALNWDINDGVNDETTQVLYENLLDTISLYNGDTLAIDPDVVIPMTTWIIEVQGVSLDQLNSILENYALLPDRVLTGLGYSYSAPTATIAAGQYKIGDTVYTSVSTPFTITPTPTGLLKKVRFYATTSGTIEKVESTPSSVVQTPDIPEGTLGLYEILVNDAGVDGDPVVDLSGYRTLDNGVFNVQINGTSASFTGGVRLENGQFFQAKRKSFESVINLLGFEAETDDVIQVFSQNWKLRNTGVGDDANIIVADVEGNILIKGTVSLANATQDSHALNRITADARYASKSSEHYRGTYPTLLALQTAIPVGNPGDEALVDAGVGQDALIYIWDDSDQDWIQGGGGSAASFATLTGSPSDNASLEARFDEKLDISALGTPVTQNFTYTSGAQTFTLSQPATTIEYVTVNGVIISGNEDYIVEDTTLTVISPNVTLVNGDQVIIRYYYGGLSAVVGSSMFANLTDSPYDNDLLSNALTIIEAKADNAQEDIDALELSKQDNLVSGTNIKTINGESVLGSGNIVISVSPVDVVFNGTSIPFNNLISYLGEIQTDEDFDISANLTGAQPGFGAIAHFIGDGTHSLSFNDMENVGGNSFDNSNGTTNTIFFIYTGNRVIYNIVDQVAGSASSPTMSSATTSSDGLSIEMTFNKAMNNPAGKHAQFTLSGGKTATAAALKSGDSSVIVLTISPAYASTDVITISYTAGDISSTDTGVLASFANRSVTNAVTTGVLSDLTIVTDGFLIKETGLTQYKGTAGKAWENLGYASQTLNGDGFVTIDVPDLTTVDSGTIGFTYTQGFTNYANQTYGLVLSAGKYKSLASGAITDSGISQVVGDKAFLRRVGTTVTMGFIRGGVFTTTYTFPIALTSPTVTVYINISIYEGTFRLYNPKRALL